MIYPGKIYFEINRGKNLNQSLGLYLCIKKVTPTKWESGILRGCEEINFIPLS